MVGLRFSACDTGEGFRLFSTDEHVVSTRGRMGYDVKVSYAHLIVAIGGHESEAAGLVVTQHLDQDPTALFALGQR